MSENHEHETGPHQHSDLVARNVWTGVTTDGSRISIDHLYPAEPEPCCACGGDCITAGLVGLILDDAVAMLTPEEAGLLANRLTRAENLVLEMTEDTPDPDREAARYAPVPDTPQG